MRRSFRPSRHSHAGYGAAELATGYYKDGGGYAWYYSAEGNYFDLIAAPSTSKVKQRARYTEGDTYEAAKKTVSEASAVTRDAALATAKAGGGKELPDPDKLGAGTSDKPGAASDEEGGGDSRPVRRGFRTPQPEPGLSMGQMVGIGAAGVALLVGIAFAVRAASD